MAASPEHGETGAGAGEARAPVVVVGSRGRGGFSELVLGSTGRQCIQLAPRPVLVVPPDLDR
jgi:nucleotide-binding universal stress UspA family protein